MIKIILFGINYDIGLTDIGLYTIELFGIKLRYRTARYKNYAIGLFGIRLRYRTVRFLYAHPEAVTFGKLSAF